MTSTVGPYLKGSPKRDDAYRFIAFASSAERQKVLSEQVTYGPTIATQSTCCRRVSPAVCLPRQTILAVRCASHQDSGSNTGDALERRFQFLGPRHLPPRKMTKTMMTTSNLPVCQDAQGKMRISHARSARAALPTGQSQRGETTPTMTMSDAMRFTPDRIEVRQGRPSAFIAENEGLLRHELVLASQRPCAGIGMMQMMPDMPAQRPQHGEPCTWRARPIDLEIHAGWDGNLCRLKAALEAVCARDCSSR